MSHEIIVDYMIGDTPYKDVFTADDSIVRLYGDGRGKVRLVNGVRSEDGELVFEKLYRHCEAITRRPV